MLDCNKLIRKRRGFLVHHVVGWVNLSLPDVLKHILCITFPEDQPEYLIRIRQADGLVKRAVQSPRLAGRFPFAIDAAEAAGPDDIPVFRIRGLKHVFAA